MKVRNKLAAGYLAIIFLIAIFGYFSVRQSKKALEKSIIESALTLSTRIADEIDFRLSSQLLQFQAYTQTQAVQDAIAKSNLQFAALDNVDAYIDEADLAWSAAAPETMTPFMQRVVENNLSEDIRRQIEVVKEKHGYDVIAELFITNKYGANLAQSGVTSDYRQNDEEWWQQAKLHGKHLGKIEYDSSAGVYAVSMAVSVTNADDEFAGILKGVVNVSNLMALIEQTKRHISNNEQCEEIFKLVDADGRLVYSTAPYKMFDNVPDIFGNKNNQVATTVDPQRGGLLCVRSRTNNDKESAGTGWTLIVEMPTSEVFAPVERLRNHLLLFALAVTVISFIMSHAITASIGKPIARLRLGMQTVASGKLDHKVAIAANDEIGDLSRTFDHMTERLRNTMVSNEELAESELRLHTIFESAADGFLIADVEKKTFTDCNPAICRMLGYTPNEIRKLGLSDIHPPEDLPYVAEQFAKQARHEITVAENLPVKRKDGSVFYADINSAPLKLQGKACLLGMFRDTTERRAVQEKLQRYSTEMERANEEVKQFAYIVSHDLRGPLTNLKGFATEIRSSLKTLLPALKIVLPNLNDEKSKDAIVEAQTDIPEALDFMDASTTRMNNLIDALLNLSRMGRRELALETLDMNEIVQEILRGLAHQLDEHDATATAGSLPNVEADRTAMEQIVANILTNAVNYLEPGRPGKIEIGGERGNEETVFYIRDNGRGISKEDMPKVFAPFRRAGKQDVKGEGMGMAYVQALVRRHGGRIQCESKPGVGTTFTFSIPHAPERNTTVPRHEH